MQDNHPLKFQSLKEIFKSSNDTFISICNIVYFNSHKIDKEDSILAVMTLSNICKSMILIEKMLDDMDEE